MGSAVGRIKAHDLDIGKNAEVEYTIVPGDGGAMFDITTNEHNQEGIIILKQVRSLPLVVLFILYVLDIIGFLLAGCSDTHGCLW